MSEAEATLNCMNAVRMRMEAKSNGKKTSGWLTSELMALLCVVNGKNHIPFGEIYLLGVPFNCYHLRQTIYPANSFLGIEQPKPNIKSFQQEKNLIPPKK